MWNSRIGLQKGDAYFPRPRIGKKLGIGSNQMEKGVIKIGQHGLLYINAITGFEHIEATNGQVAHLLVHLGKNSIPLLDWKDEFAQLQVKSCVPVKVPQTLGFLACVHGCCNVMTTDGKTRFICNGDQGFALYQAIHKNDMN